MFKKGQMNFFKNTFVTIFI